METEIVNLTPFVPLSFESIDAELNHFGVLVIRGTFKILNNAPLALSSHQDTMVLEDEYYGDPKRSSMRRDSGLTPYKPRTDVLIEATAYAPRGSEQESWTASVKAGTLEKTFVVTGPRSWSSRFGMPRLGDIAPIAKLPIRYEQAFGGTSSDGQRFAENPVGIGFETRIGRLPVAAPQLLPLNARDPVFGQPLPVIGLGPIPPSWQQRLRWAGTYDEAWRQTKAPYLPSDFSFAFYNVASTGMSFAGFAEGDESFQLVNLSEERDLRFTLPNVKLLALIHFADGRTIPGPIQLDTIELEIEAKTAFLQWRMLFPAQIPTRAIEVRMAAPESLIIL
jgi:hypothetical protein